MRKWSLVLFCLTALIALIVLVGCEGDTGGTGVKGSKGRQGSVGYDPDHQPPADRVLAFAVTNRSENAASGKRQLFLTFDSTAKSSRDTVVASRVSVPPLIDGVDAEEFEWGAQKSKMPLSFLNPDAGVADCKLKNGIVRVAYDDDNIYFQFQWQEQPVKGVASVGESRELNELIFFFKGRYPDDTPIRTLKKFQRYSCQEDSILEASYPRVRINYTPNCLYKIGTECGCWDYRSTDITKVPPPDTTYLWAPRSGSAEDRLAVFFPSGDTTGWQNVALKQFFGFNSGSAYIPSDMFVDVWAWGAARTSPVSVADDWVIDANGSRADAGQAPYIDNWNAADSLPIFMNRRDPNIRNGETPAKQGAVIYPLWYFDAVGYQHYNWAVGTDSTGPASRGSRIDCSLPGVITTIPSGSRADVYAAARFDNSGGFWTVEIKRARRTHNGDDVQF